MGKPVDEYVHDNIGNHLRKSCRGRRNMRSKTFMLLFIDFDTICWVGQQPMLDSHGHPLRSYRMRGRVSAHTSTLDLICVSRSMYDTQRQMHAVNEATTFTAAESHNLVYANTSSYTQASAMARKEPRRLCKGVDFQHHDGPTRPTS